MEAYAIKKNTQLKNVIIIPKFLAKRLTISDKGPYSFETWNSYRKGKRKCF